MRRLGRRRRALGAAVALALVIAIPAWAYWAFSPNQSTTFAAATLNGTASVTVPEYSSGTVTVTWAAVVAPGGGAVDGYYVRRFLGASPSAACGTAPGTLTTLLSCSDTGVTAGTYTYQVTAVFKSWTATTASSAMLVDTTAPSEPTATLTAATGNSFISGTTAFTNPQAGKAGGFTVTSAPTDAESGILDVTFPTLAGFTSGGGADAASPYTTTYAWSGAEATASGSQTITARNNALTPATATFTVTPDTAPPTGGAVQANGSAAASSRTNGTMPLTWTAFTEAGSGVGTNAMTRATGTLAANACGEIAGATAVINPDGPDGYDAATLTSGCYQYTLTGTDNVGNAATAQSAIVKVDTTAPVFTITATGTNVGTDGTSVYYRNVASGGSFTLTASDPETGVTGSPTFPTFTGWTQSGTGNTRTYAVSTAATAGATASGSITNGAGATSTPSITTVLQNATFAAFDIQATGNGNDQPDTGDTISYTFGAVINPNTAMTGWTGSSTAVQLVLAGNTNTSATVLTVAGGSTNMGTIVFGAGYKANGNCTSCTLTGTMTLATVAGRSVATLTITNSATGLNADDGTHNMSWAQSTSVRDWGNNAALGTSKTEIGVDADF